MQVLKSHLLPASVADEQLADVIRALPDNPGMYEEIIDSVFAMAEMSDPLSSPGQLSWTGISGEMVSHFVSAESVAMAGFPEDTNPSVILSMFRAVQKVCRSHGVVPMQSRLVCSLAPI